MILIAFKGATKSRYRSPYWLWRAYVWMVGGKAVRALMRAHRLRRAADRAQRKYAGLVLR